MLRSYAGMCVVEIREIAGLDVDRAKAQADFLGIGPVEIHQLLERRPEVYRFVKACRCLTLEPVNVGFRTKETRSAEEQGGHCARLAREILSPICPEIKPTCRRFRYCFPEFSQLGDAAVRGIAGDNRRIDRADRDPRHPCGGVRVLGQTLVYACLISTQGSTALQNQSDLLVRHFIQSS